MNADDWKLELQRLFEIFERETTISLRNINRCFEVLGHPFGEEFRQYFLKMSTVRLDASFNTVLMERNFDHRMQMPSTSNGQRESDEVTTVARTLMTIDNVDPLITPQNDNLLDWKIKNKGDAPTKILETHDESAEVKEDDHVESNAPPKDTKTDNPDGEPSGTGSNAENDANISLKCEPENENADDAMNLPFVNFDPVDDNENLQNGVSVLDPIDTPQSQSSSLSNIQQRKINSLKLKLFKCKDCDYAFRHKQVCRRHRLVHNDVKPYKCERCDYACRQKGNLKTHKRIHDREKLMGIVRDPNSGLYKCPHCDQQFTKWQGLRKHMTQTHKNNQRLFNCKRCIRGFTQKIEKDSHEMQCQERRYECYVCKKYVAKYAAQIQQHMRTHSGVRPFECEICNKSYRQRSGLKYHLDAIHS